MRLAVLGLRRLGVLLLLMPSLLGCAHSAAHAPKHESGSSFKASPIRVIVTFDRLPAATDERPLALIAELCACTPHLLRQFLGNSYIYEIALPADRSYDTFERMLLDKGAGLGVRGVEQDVLLRLQ